MGYLAAEILALIAGAALLGIILGWAIFGLRRIDVDTSKLVEDLESERELRKKNEQRLRDAETKEAKALERLQERDTTIAELRHQNDEIARIRVQTAMDLQQRDARILALESQLKSQDASSPNIPIGHDIAHALEERDRTIVKLKAELDHTLSQMSTSGDAARVRELERENAELRAALVLSPEMGESPAESAPEELSRLKDEVRALRAAYEAAEQSLDEQEQLVSSLRVELSQAQKASLGPKTDRQPTLDFEMDRESEKAEQEASRQPFLPPTKREDRLGPVEEDSMTAALVDLLTQIEGDQVQGQELLPALNESPTQAPSAPELPPKKVEPVKTQPASVTPITGTSAKVEPAKVEPAKVESAKAKPVLASAAKPLPGASKGGLLSGSDLKAKLAERANQAKPGATRPNARVVPTQTLKASELPQTTEEVRPAISGVQAVSIEATSISEAIPASASASKPAVPEQNELNALTSLLAQIEARAAALLPELPKLETKTVSKHIAEPLQELDELTTLQAERLDQVGVRTFKQLAELSDNDIQALSKWMEVTPEFIHEHWVAPAKARASA